MNLIAGTLSRTSCGLNPDTLIHADYYDDRLTEMIQLLYSGAGFSEEEKQILECTALLPPDGVSGELFQLLFPKDALSVAEDLKRCGWLNCAKGIWGMNYRIRKVIAGQEIAGKTAREFLTAAASISLEGLSAKEAAQLKKLLKQRNSFL